MEGSLPLSGMSLSLGILAYCWLVMERGEFQMQMVQCGALTGMGDGFYRPPRRCSGCTSGSGSWATVGVGQLEIAWLHRTFAAFATA